MLKFADVNARGNFALPQSPQLKRIGVQNTSIISYPFGWWTTWTLRLITLRPTDHAIPMPIITESYGAAQRFLKEVDSAAVYVNASTVFTDGYEFGLGAEVGISTQKLHSRGPMGLEGLTTYKYIVYGNGQVRK